MLKINGKPVPQDFIKRHGNLKTVNGFEYVTCKCGVDFEAVGDEVALVKSPGFKTHLIQAFENYHTKHLGLLGGNANG